MLLGLSQWKLNGFSFLKIYHTMNIIINRYVSILATVKKDSQTDMYVHYLFWWSVPYGFYEPIECLSKCMRSGLSGTIFYNLVFIKYQDTEFVVTKDNLIQLKHLASNNPMSEKNCVIGFARFFLSIFRAHVPLGFNQSGSYIGRSARHWGYHRIRWIERQVYYNAQY